MCLLAVIAYGDLHTRRIPNVLVWAIAVLGLFRMTVAGGLIAATHSSKRVAQCWVSNFLLSAAALWEAAMRSS
jgi:Flp pilus assembly protein protease CpaA